MFYPGLHIGTSGWSYQHWSGLFYPVNIKPEKYLEYYLTKFDCVELNASFYHLPQPATAAGWIRRTPADFRFCPKLSKHVTHQLRLANADEALNRYFDVFGIMQERLGPVLIQLPPGLSFDISLITGFLNSITDRYPAYQFAVEIRHKSWINDTFLDLLHQHGMAFVIADSGKRFPCHEVVTADFIYLRFHGREKLYASDYSDTDLGHYAGKIMNWLLQGKEIWAFFNNDYHGFAVKNAIRLKEMIR